MKTNIMVLLFIILMLAANGFACEFSQSQGTNSNFNYKNKQYKTILPLYKLSKINDFIIGNTEFPKQISKIIEIGKEMIQKIDSELNWSVQSLGCSAPPLSSSV